MVYYRRRSNWIGWLAFFGIGGLVFVGLIIGFIVLKDRQNRIQKEADVKSSERQAKLLDPRKNILEKISQAYREKGLYLNQGSVRMNLAEKARSSKAPDKEYVVVRVQHRALAKRDDEDEPPTVDEVFVVEIVGTTVKLTKLPWENWEKQREGLGFDEEVTKKLEGAAE